MSDLANHAAANTAGYQRIQTDRGVGKTPRYFSRYEKTMSGATGDGPVLLKAHGESNVDQATADSQALAVLNGQRLHRYGSGATPNQSGKGGTHTFDNT